MISNEYKRAATLVLAKCATKDLWFPNVGEAVILGWAEVFQQSRLTAEELLDGVEHAYEKEEQGYRPLPASIVSHARAAYFEALKSLSEEQRHVMEMSNHILQDMGVTPPDAHRASRRVALGRVPDIRLTEEQIAEFNRRLAERQALEATPPKPLGLDGIVKTVNEVLAADETATPDEEPDHDAA
ncbi:hypothetical protein [Nocardia otitidiscaviarum]|uniref:hypothetical protein n=1 Tax=Nocardia otitidiscaviarum TaxID=1823 RepID=UPI0005BA50EF|nr:hypothetical protein [Nocardia otitidiscaviarum]